MTIDGFNFSATPSANVVKFGGVQSVVTASSYFGIQTSVPVGAVTDFVTVEVGGEKATSPNVFVVLLPPTIAGFTPASGTKGTTVKVQGTNFSTNPSSNLVSFGAYPAVVTASTPFEITTAVPMSIPDQTPPLFLTVDNGVGSATSASAFQVLYPPVITDFDPKVGTPGTEITISGANFSPVLANNTVLVGTDPTTVLNASLSELVVKTSASVTPGAITVTTPDGTAVSSEIFNVILPRLGFVVSSTEATVASFLINSSTGELRPNGFVHVGGSAKSLVVTPDGNYAYVAQSGTSKIAEYAVQNGSLAPLIDSTGAAATIATGAGPESIAIHPGGLHVYTADKTGNTVSMFKVESSGLLSALSTPNVAVDPSPVAIVLDATGSKALAVHLPFGGNGSVSLLSRNASTGELTVSGSADAGSVFFGINGPVAAAFHPNGNFAYAANNNENLIHLYDVSGGTIDSVTDGGGNPVTFATDLAPSALVFDPTGKYLLVANKNSNTISVFEANPANGLLTSLGATPVPGVGTSASAPASIFVEQNGFVYASASGSSEMVVFQLDSQTGALSFSSEVRTRPGAAGFVRTIGPGIAEYDPFAAFTAINGNGDVESFQVQPDGSLVSNGLSGPLIMPPIWVSPDITARLLYLAIQGDAANPWMLTKAVIDQTSGALSSLATYGVAAPNNIYGGRAITLDHSTRRVIILLEKFSVNPKTSHITSIAIDNNPASTTFGNLTGGFTIVNIPAISSVQPDSRSLALSADGRFVYVASPGVDRIHGWSLNVTSGALTAIAGNPFSVSPDTGPYAVAGHPSGRFLYAATNQSVLAFDVAQNGAPTKKQTMALGATPFTTSGSSLAVHPLGKFLYLILNNESVRSYQIDPSDGTLSAPQDFSPGVPGSVPYSLAIDPSGAYLYVANSAGPENVVVFDIDPQSGSLTVNSSTTGLPGDAPKGVAASGLVK